MRNSPPEAPLFWTTQTILDQTLNDEYGWSRVDPPPALRAHLQAEEAYFVEESVGRTSLIRELEADLLSATPATGSLGGSLLQVGNWFYWNESMPSGRSRVMRRPAAQDREPAATEIVIDEDDRGRSIAGYRRGTTDVSLDGAVVAFSERRSGRPGYELLCGEPPNSYVSVAGDVASQFVLSPDGSTLFFLRKDSAQRPFQLWRRSVANPADEHVLHAEVDSRYRLGLSKSRCATMLIVTSRSRADTEIYSALFSDLVSGDVLINVRTKGQGAVSSIEVIRTGGRTLVGYLESRSGVDGISVATVYGEPFNGRLLEVHAGDSLVRMQALQHGIALQTRHGGRSSVGHLSTEQVERWAESPDRVLSSDSLAVPALTTLQRRLGENATWAHPTYAVTSSSLTSLPRTVDVSFSDRLVTDAARDQSEASRHSELRIKVPVQDGTLVPVYIAQPAHSESGAATPAPAVLRFYGAYGVVTDPVYSPATLALLDRGFTVILIQPRGGGELGPEWWRSGRREHKERTISDVLDVTHYLAAAGLIEPGRVALEAHSAGGLIAAAVVLRRPDLFFTAVLTNPFVDPVGALSDSNLPLAVSDWDEWGNPLRSLDDLTRLRSLSPYESLPADCSHVPPILVIGSLDDDRVSIVEPCKFVARLRDRGGHALLHVRMHSDHTFAGTPAEGRRETAALLAWICALSDQPRARTEGER